MEIITREELEAKENEYVRLSEKVDKLWRAANANKIAATKVEEEYKSARYEYISMLREYYSQHESQKE